MDYSESHSLAMDKKKKKKKNMTGSGSFQSGPQMSQNILSWRDFAVVAPYFVFGHICMYSSEVRLAGMLNLRILNRGPSFALSLTVFRCRLVSEISLHGLIEERHSGVSNGKVYFDYVCGG